MRSNDRVQGLVRLSSAAFAAVALLLVAPGCAASREYGDVLHGRSSCDSCQGPDWSLYREMSSGRLTCDTGCECAAAPACGCEALPAYPPGAKPGEAWCRVVIPAEYETIREPVQTACASVEKEWIPPVTEIRLKRVCVAPAWSEVIHTPGATRTDEMCAEGCPARQVTREVTVRGPCGCEKRCETVTIPATNCTTHREVCIQAPGREAISVPAQYVEEPCIVEVVPGRWVDRVIPPVVEMRERIVCKRPERVEWRRNPTCEVPVATVPNPCRPAAASTGPVVRPAASK